MLFLELRTDIKVGVQDLPVIEKLRKKRDLLDRWYKGKLFRTPN